jgi:VanZ family protein
MNTLKVVFIKTLRWLTVFSYMVVIFVFSSQEAYKSDSFSVGITSFVVKTLGLPKLIYRENSVYEIDYNTIFSKTAHIMEFFILTVLLYMVLKLSGSNPKGPL